MSSKSLLSFLLLSSLYSCTHSTYIRYPDSSSSSSASVATQGSHSEWDSSNWDTSSKSTSSSSSSSDSNSGSSSSNEKVVAGSFDAEPTSLVAQLIAAGTALERYSLLSVDDFKYDFNAPPANATTQDIGGVTVKADRLTFPALVGTGVSMTVGFLGPCGFNTPHTHPRGSEFNIIVQGTLHAEFITENGASLVGHDLNTFQAVIIPQGSVHTEFNPNCENATFVAAFGSEDPGVQQSAQTFFSLDEDVVESALGTGASINGKDIDAFAKYLPKNVAQGVGECLKKCGIQKRDYAPQ